MFSSDITLLIKAWLSHCSGPLQLGYSDYFLVTINWERLHIPLL